jgi:hypothetical protein
MKSLPTLWGPTVDIGGEESMESLLTLLGPYF